jgi:hypothetical protein
MEEFSARLAVDVAFKDHSLLIYHSLLTLPAAAIPTRPAIPAIFEQTPQPFLAPSSFMKKDSNR